MSADRWHRPPRTSPLVIIPGLVLGLVLLLVSTQFVTDELEYIAAIQGTAPASTPVRALLLAAALTAVCVPAALAITQYRRCRTPQAVRRRFLRSPGWAARPRRDMNSTHGIAARLHVLIPSTHAARSVEDASVPLGTDRRGRPWLLACDESILVIGPPGSGKDRRVAAPVLSQWPGPALVTSTKADLAEATITARAARGPVAVFDPAGFDLVPGATPLRWNPILGCDDADVAARRAAAIIAGGAPSMNEQFWTVAATRILRGTLRAAALDGRDVVQATTWATSVPGWLTAADTLTAHGEHEWATALRDDAQLDPRTTGSIAATLTGALIGMSNAKLRDALTPRPGEVALDLGALLAASGTVYAVAPAEPDSHLVFRPWTTLLASEVAALLREAARGRRLEPPALLLLNELVHVCPLPELPGLLADGRGHNIATMAIVQDPAQLSARYSPEESAAIVAAAQHRLLLSAGGDDTAREWSDLIGNYRRTTRTRQHKAMGITATGSSTAADDAPIMPAGELRHLPYGAAVLLPRGAPALPITLHGT